uniref:Protein-glutamate O-methyltransferase CheR n=1 Tax=Roseihalotalea indica TaxID=2867963 RepID=A0AA49GRI2_9BACT|nr:protein-glutamate O-methyltransferase CheR [Tunicatimonas sp. TK19036]
MASITVSDEELQSLTQAILRRYDIDFTCYEPNSLKRRIARSINVLKLESVHNLWVKLLKDRSFIYPFMDEISVGLTSMFRDPILWRTLKNDILTPLGRKDTIDVWHAGCSTGEEVYSMGIVLHEKGLLAKTKALATDISEAAMATARTGKYHELKIAEYEKNYQQYNATGLFRRYHQPNCTGHVMNKELVEHVTFKSHNLITDLPPRKFDIIFCRNVMIYFDHASKVRLIQQFHDYLNEGGYLIIGFYDALVPLIDKSKYHYTNLDAKIFQKI